MSALAEGRLLASELAAHPIGADSSVLGAESSPRTLLREGLPVSELPEFRRPLDGAPLKEPSVRAPFAYQFAIAPPVVTTVATEVGDAPIRSPEMITHAYSELHTSCNSHLWIDTRCLGDVG